jgi:(p)ppGpp synthase/HD superfamily hydrolase
MDKNSENAMNHWAIDRYKKALHFAARAHGDQKVPGTQLPYLLHLTSVSLEVISALPNRPDGDADLAIVCALLHDVIEDTEVTFELVQREFGKAVAEGVLALTKDESVPKDQRLADSLKRIRQQPPEIGMVKLADRISNLQPPPAFWTQEKIKQYFAESKMVYEMLQSADAYLADRLLGKIREYEQYLG